MRPDSVVPIYLTFSRAQNVAGWLFAELQRPLFAAEINIQGNSLNSRCPDHLWAVNQLTTNVYTR